MPVVRLSDSTMEKLRPLAVPLEDSVDSLLSRLADAAHAGVPYKLPASTKHAAAKPQPPSLTNGERPHDLAFTRLVSAEFEGSELIRCNWNTLAKHVHEIAFKRLGSFEALQRATRARIRPGRYEEDGFTYLPEANLSIQGMDSNMAWDSCVSLARAMVATLSVELEWRNNPKAARPGERTRLSYRP